MSTTLKTLALILVLLATGAHAAPLSNPAVDRYNVRIGTQTFGPLYQFTSTNVLLETALAMRSMGSDIIKFAMGTGAQSQYGITFPSGITNLQAQARNEPVCRQVLGMAFRHYFIWTHVFAQSVTSWTDGYSTTEREREYNEIYAFTRYLLTNYTGSGKSFYLGHWEGDWYLLPGYDASTNPSPTRLQGMRDWLNTRQLAVDDAVRTVAHSNVTVFHYTEVNRVRDAMINGPGNNQRLANAVLPYVTNIDYVSWSSYDGQNLGTTDLHATLDYIAGKMSTNKAGRISGRRVFIGEYGWGDQTSAAQEPTTRAYMQRALPWGIPFMLFWEMYNNEPGRRFWLIDDTNTKTPCYFLHANFANAARMAAARFFERNGRLPDDEEFESLTVPLLGAPLVSPVAVTVENAGVTGLGDSSATVAAIVRQNIYGDQQAGVSIFWGPQDGGVSKANWQREVYAGLNTNFNATAFTAVLSNVPAGTNYFRACATNASGTFWAAESVPFVVEPLNTNAFGYRTKFSLSPGSPADPLVNFPVLIKLGTHLEGFSYQQFASPRGGDLRFTAADGRLPLSFEIQEWNTNGESLVWVRIPLLQHSGGSVWAFWGDPLAPVPPAPATNGAFWSRDHHLAWHMEESTPPYADAAGLHPGLPVLAAPASTPGWLGKGLYFDGLNRFLTAGPVSLGDQFTLSAWVKLDPTASDIQTLWANKTSGFSQSGFGLFINSYQTTDLRLAFEAGNGTVGSRVTTAAGAVTPGLWQHVAVAVDRPAGITRLFVNGIEGTGAGTIESTFRNQGELLLGAFTNRVFQFKGALDEVRVSKQQLSGDWLRTHWRNLASNNTFAASEPTIRFEPKLIAALVGTNLLLTWPAPSVGALVLMATNLLPPVTWTALSSRPSLTNNQWLVTVPLKPEAHYFRLQIP